MQNAGALIRGSHPPNAPSQPCLIALCGPPPKSITPLPHLTVAYNKGRSLLLFYLLLDRLPRCLAIPNDPFCPRRSQSSPSCSGTPAPVPYLFGHRRVGAHRVPQHSTSLAHFFTCPRRVESFTNSFFFFSRCPRKLNPRFVHHTWPTVQPYSRIYAIFYFNPCLPFTGFRTLLLTLVDSARLLRNPKPKLPKAPSQRPRGGQNELFLPTCSSAKIGEKESRPRTPTLGSVSGFPLPCDIHIDSVHRGGRQTARRQMEGAR